MMFAIRSKTLSLAGIVCSLAACSSAGPTAADGGTGVSASMSSMSVSAGTAAGAAGAVTAPGGATFTEVFNLLAGGCASGGYCHAAGGGLSKLELVDQTKAYQALVGTTAMGNAMPGSMTTGCSMSMIARVKAGDPDNSLLMQKLSGTQTCGGQMPPNGTLKPDELKLVHDWIAAGAKND